MWIVLFNFLLFSFTLLHTQPLNPALNTGLPQGTGSALIIVCKLFMDTSGFLPTASSPLMWGVLVHEPLRCRCYSCYCLMRSLAFDSVSGIWGTKVLIIFFSSCIHTKSTAHTDLQWEAGIPMLSMSQTDNWKMKHKYIEDAGLEGVLGSSVM